MSSAQSRFLDSGQLDIKVLSIVQRLEDAALLASNLILSKLEQGQKLASWRKGDDTVVTEADIESQALLVKELGDLLPLVCEEDPQSHKLIDTTDDFIVIDPLDGTTSARRFGTAQGGQVGYGPILGLVMAGRVVGATFVNIPQRQGFTAILNGGCDTYPMLDPLNSRSKLPAIGSRSVEKSAMLFYAGKKGELEALARLRKKSALENYYRFGGFANDSLRIALDYEQAQLQFSVKAWDLPAALFPHQAGCRVVLDPQGQAIDLENYRPKLENPLLLGHPTLVGYLLPLLQGRVE